jgi:hypothetical protein
MTEMVLVLYLLLARPGSMDAPSPEPVLMRAMSKDACEAAVARSPKEPNGWMVACLTPEEAKALRHVPEDDGIRIPPPR